MSTYSKLVGTVLAALLLFGIAGCEPDGPMERAGEAVDNAADEVGDAAEDVKDELD